MARSVIEKDLVVEGDMVSAGGVVEVKGRVVGDLQAQAIVVHTGGSVDGILSAATVTIEGTQVGAVRCDEVKLASSADVRADIDAQVMATESGAKVIGKISVSGVSQVE